MATDMVTDNFKIIEMQNAQGEVIRIKAPIDMPSLAEIEAEVEAFREEFADCLARSSSDDFIAERRREAERE